MKINSTVQVFASVAFSGDTDAAPIQTTVHHCRTNNEVFLFLLLLPLLLCWPRQLPQLQPKTPRKLIQKVQDLVELRPNTTRSNEGHLRSYIEIHRHSLGDLLNIPKKPFMRASSTR
mmetsp:Transcript_45693/g.87861  ORF Transcript_45693/g.87861 Transcript_45693/m.87861 type:complete len:117 (-) Transcript_45693:1219-1569(-)